jgi:myo-inositol-1(or 4)-monophosphatase
VDGTANFLHGLPLYAVSLGLLRERQAVLGVISLPFLGRFYWAADGHGAWRDDSRITASTTSTLNEAIVAVGDYGTGPCSSARNRADFALHRQLAAKAQRVRMLGSAAVDLAWVADTSLDASITLGNSPWDTAAGVAIAREAGVTVIDVDGSAHTTDSRVTIAAAPHLADALLALVRSALLGTAYLHPDPSSRSIEGTHADQL